MSHDPDQFQPVTVSVELVVPYDHFQVVCGEIRQAGGRTGAFARDHRRGRYVVTAILQPDQVTHFAAYKPTT